MFFCSCLSLRPCGSAREYVFGFYSVSRLCARSCFSGGGASLYFYRSFGGFCEENNRPGVKYPLFFSAGGEERAALYSEKNFSLMKKGSWSDTFGKKLNPKQRR
jgi:hypothetical protein